MYKEFEGKTEKEAIDTAIDELGIDREEFDVEIVETSKKGLLFKKGLVKIRVHMSDIEGDYPVQENVSHNDNDTDTQYQYEEADPEKVQDISRFLETMIEKMGFPGKITTRISSEGKQVLDIDSEHSGILIGKQGKNLDALQLLVNVYAGKLGVKARIIVDAEGYRKRREEALNRLAKKTADQVRKSRGSRLLEPMNPFERRLIHTALNNMRDIDTKSEGEGLYKQVRIMYRTDGRS